MKIRLYAPKGIRIPFPASVKADAEKALDGSNRCWLQYMTTIGGEPAEVVYGGRRTKARGIEIQLAFASTPARSWIAWNLNFNRISGYYMTWPDTKSPYGIGTFDLRVKAKGEPTAFGMPRSRKAGAAEIMAAGGLPKWFCIEPDDVGNDIIGYISEFSKRPEIEMMTKMGIGYLWRHKTASRPEVLAFIKRNAKAIRELKPSPSVIQYAVKHGMRVEDAAADAEAVEWHRILSRFAKTIGEAKEMARYVAKATGHSCAFRSDVIHYRDYLGLCQAQGLDIAERGIRFPRDFRERMDAMKFEAAEADLKRMHEEMVRQASELGAPTEWSKLGLKATLVTSTEEMRAISDTLHNCVGRCGYDRKAAEGRSLIICVRQGDAMKNCVEIETPKANGRKFKVLQNYGDHNFRSDVQGDAERLMSSYVASLNRKWRKKNEMQNMRG